MNLKKMTKEKKKNTDFINNTKSEVNYELFNC